MFVQDRSVVPPHFKLKFLEGRNDLLSVACLGYKTERQRKHREIRVNAIQPVIAALIDEDDIV